MATASVAEHTCPDSRATVEVAFIVVTVVGVSDGVACSSTTVTAGAVCELPDDVAADGLPIAGFGRAVAMDERADGAAGS